MGPELEYLSVATFYAIFFLGLVAAFYRGGAPERAAAAILAGLFAIQSLIYVSVPPRFLNVDLVSFSIDLACFTGMSWIAIHAKRVWPIWAASFQLLSIAAHFARFVQVQIEPLVYSIMKSSPTGAVAMLILVGTILHQERLTKNGSDQSWMDWKSVRRVR